MYVVVGSVSARGHLPLLSIPSRQLFFAVPDEIRRGLGCCPLTGCSKQLAETLDVPSHTGERFPGATLQGDRVTRSVRVPAQWTHWQRQSTARPRQHRRDRGQERRAVRSVQLLVGFKCYCAALGQWGRGRSTQTGNTWICSNRNANGHMRTLWLKSKYSDRWWALPLVADCPRRIRLWVGEECLCMWPHVQYIQDSTRGYS